MLEAPGNGTERETALLSPLTLAYIGDTVWDLMVRTGLLHTGMNLRNMHCAAISKVNAKAQAQALSRLEGKLTAEEMDLVRRGRNAHPRHGAPRNQDPASYCQATGLEALIGYLYLSGHHDRLAEIYRLATGEAVS